MEVIRKINKTKKIRRCCKSKKKDKFSKDVKNFYDDDCKNNTDDDHPCQSIKKDEDTQTDEFCHYEKNILTEKEEQIKTLTEKLQQTTAKFCESKNACVLLKQELNKAQKLLYSEIGENVTLSRLPSDQQLGWRGRAEQIHQLQQKVSELQTKLSDNGTKKISLDRRSLSSARILEKERKQQIENLSKELRDVETNNETTKKKLEAARARAAVLENEVNKSKRTIALLNDKTTNDKRIIEVLNEQLKTNELKLQDRESEVKRQNEKYEREIVLLKSEIEAMDIHLQNFKRQIEEREKENELLRHRNDMITDRFNVNRTPFYDDDSSKSSVREANECIAVGIAAEAEKDRLLELITVLNRRIDKERYDFEQLSESYKKERSRGLKLEAKLQRMEVERAGMSRVNTGTYRSKGKFGTIDGNQNDINEDARLRLELLEEESLALKTRLATIQKEKAADLVTFKKILFQTTKIFKDANKGKLPPNVGCRSFVTV